MGLGHADFVALFDAWADSYDATVLRSEPVDGFEEYEHVLDEVVRLGDLKPGDVVADIGSGTGNLASRLLAQGAVVLAVEPSSAMRRIASRKLPGARVMPGHFRALGLDSASLDAVLSTYAFHHLTDEEKVEGLNEALRVLRPGGRIVIGDIAWADHHVRTAMIRRFERQGKHALVQEMEEEYYPTVEVMEQLFAFHGCHVAVRQVTEWVWTFAATRP